MRRLRLRSSSLPALLAGLACTRPSADPVIPASGRDVKQVVDTLTLRAAASFLADDALLGRGTGTPGGWVTAAYLASECRRLGLIPLTPAGYAHELPLTEATIVPESTTIRITGPGMDTTVVHWDDFLPDLATPATLRGFEGALA